MSTSVLKDQKVWFDGFDLTGAMNALAVNYGVDALDATVLGNDTRINKAGLKTVAASLEGFFDTAPYDQALFNNVGAANKVLSYGVNSTVGSPTYSFKALIGSYQPGASIGEMFSFSLEAGAAGDLVRGTLMENNSAVTADDSGTGLQLGAVGPTQKLYAALHVLGVSGTAPTLNIDIESDDNAGFSSAISRISFDEVSTIGSQWQELPGTISDDYWRASWTVGGTSASFDFVVILGIL